VPLLAPVGPYSMRMQAWDQGGDGVMCVDLWFHVVASSAAGAAGSGSGGSSSGGIGSGVGGVSVDSSSSGGGGDGGSSSQWRQQHHYQQQQTRQMRVGAREQSQQLPFTTAT
jgi:hypothetical protein